MRCAALQKRLVGRDGFTSPPGPLSESERGVRLTCRESAVDDKPIKDVTRWQTSPQLWEKLKPLTRQKRHEPTPAELHLWKSLRNRQVLGFKFRRQHSIDK